MKERNKKYLEFHKEKLREYHKKYGKEYYSKQEIKEKEMDIIKDDIG